MQGTERQFCQATYWAVSQVGHARTYGLIWVPIQHFVQKSIDFTVGAKINFAKKFGTFQRGSKN